MDDERDPSLSADGEPSDGSLAQGMDRAFAAARDAGHADPDPLIGAKGGGYTLTEYVLKGGQANVYKARHAALGDCAVKVVLDDTDDPTTPDRLALEAKRMRRLHEKCSRHFVCVYDLFPHPPSGTVWMVMEWLSGWTAAQRLGQGQSFRWEEAFRIVSEVLMALEFVHAENLAHGDIKPSNIFLLTDSSKLIDLGLARTTHGRYSNGRDFPFSGTPTYAAPETFDGGPLGPLTDVYSVGVTLFELLTGKPPYAAPPGAEGLEKFTHLRRAHANGNPEWEDPLLPISCKRIVSKAMAINPAERYQTAAAFQADLQDAIAGQRASNEVIGGPTTRWTGWKFAFAATFVALTAVIGWNLARPRQEFAGSGVIMPPGPLHKGGLENPTPPPAELDGDVTIVVRPRTTPRSRPRDVRALKDQVTHEGDEFRIEAKLNRPAFMYVLQLDTEGILWSLDPWSGPKFQPRREEKKVDVLRVPADDHGELQVAPIGGGPAGVETVLVLARDKSLSSEEEASMRNMFAKVPREATGEFRCVLSLKNGVILTENGRGRGPIQLAKSRPVEEIIPQTRALLRGDLRMLFPFTFGVAFPRE